MHLKDIGDNWWQFTLTDAVSLHFESGEYPKVEFGGGEFQTKNKEYYIKFIKKQFLNLNQ